MTCATCHPEALTPGDREVVTTFQRFLRAVGGPPTRPVPRGWVPYCLGLPAPPEGSEDVPLTAWRFPA